MTDHYDIMEVAGQLRAALPAVEEAKAMAEAEFVTRNNIRVMTAGSASYPRRLGMCADAPRVLFGLGRCNLDAPCVVGVVGTRRASVSGIEFVRRVVTDLAARMEGLVVVSGLAYGIDITAHKAALAAGVPTAAVVAHGLNMIYPAEHRDTAARMIAAGGAVLSEYMTGSRVHRYSFLARNRIIAGLCDVVLVAESDVRGGALVTARKAREYGRPVCAAPARWNDTSGRGCNALIASGAAELVMSADDVIRVAGWHARPSHDEMPRLVFYDLEAPARAIVEHLRKHPDASVDDMTRALHMSAAELSARLMEMEMDDVVTSVPGGRFQLNF